jgi:1-aminocyclopropane-1-carboxylate deaminase/D-cysteine desulfhydrase-like pyridoxal-dependent ACC family enzyme
MRTEHLTKNRPVSRFPVPHSISPDAEIESIAVLNGSAFVVRDDRLNGGTKQRAAVPFVAELAARGISEFVYASPFCGFAQVALAAACQAMGVKCVLFAESDKSLADGAFVAHEFTRLARDLGAQITIANDLADATRMSESYCRKQNESFLVPLGFDCASFRHYLKFEIGRQWKIISDLIHDQPRTLWLPVGSGTLAGVFRSVISDDTEIRAINVRVLDSSDPRIKKIANLDGVEMSDAPMNFAERATLPPPIPSNVYYDAKIWATFYREAQIGDIWWNVAR